MTLLTESGVLQGEVLVGELVAIDGLAAGAVVVREVAALSIKERRNSD